jgi:polyadenylate-binding protein
MKNFAPAVTFDVSDKEAVKAYEKEREEEVRKVFDAMGAVTSVFVKLDLEKKAPYAFIAFANHEDAKKVVQKFDHKKYQIF